MGATGTWDGAIDGAGTVGGATDAGLEAGAPGEDTDSASELAEISAASPGATAAWPARGDWGTSGSVDATGVLDGAIDGAGTVGGATDADLEAGAPGEDTVA